MSRMSQGGAANKHGRQNELNMSDMLERNKFRYVATTKQRDVIRRLRHELDAPTFSWDEFNGVFTTQARLGIGLFDQVIREDYLIIRRGWPEALAISVKHQYKPGSATRKLEHVYTEIRECYPCRCAVLLEGPQFTKPIIKRGLYHVTKSNGQVACIFQGIGDFSRWLTNGAEWPEYPIQGLLN